MNPAPNPPMPASAPPDTEGQPGIITAATTLLSPPFVPQQTISFADPLGRKD